MQRLKSPGSAQKFVPTHAAVYNTFNVQRHLVSAQTHRALRADAMTTWRTASAAGLTIPEPPTLRARGTATRQSPSDATRRGVFRSLAELDNVFEVCLEQRNAEPKPFVWTAPAADILEKVAKGRQALESVR